MAIDDQANRLAASNLQIPPGSVYTSERRILAIGVDDAGAAMKEIRAIRAAERLMSAPVCAGKTVVAACATCVEVNAGQPCRPALRARAQTIATVLQHPSDSYTRQREKDLLVAEIGRIRDVPYLDRAGNIIAGRQAFTVDV